MAWIRGLDRVSDMAFKPLKPGDSVYDGRMENDAGMQMLTTLAKTGDGTAIWAKAEIERLRAALAKAEDDKFEYGQERYGEGYSDGCRETEDRA